MSQPIEVRVQTRYVAAQSQPAQRRFVFTYTITISNQGEEAAQLISRHWRIRDARDQLQEVQGLGVVGEQPHLAPGASYTYTSGVILETETGMMEGSYEFEREDGERFTAPIPAFALVPPHAMH
jgi:ApaG protein